MRHSKIIKKEDWRKYVENLSRRVQSLRRKSSSNHIGKSCWFSQTVFSILVNLCDEFYPTNPNMPHTQGCFVFYNLLGSSTIELSYIFTAKKKDKMFPFKFTCITIDHKKYYLNGSDECSYFFPMHFEKW